VRAEVIRLDGRSLPRSKELLYVVDLFRQHRRPIEGVNAGGRNVVNAAPRRRPREVKRSAHLRTAEERPSVPDRISPGRERYGRRVCPEKSQTDADVSQTR
jgi:hypothetical protein